MIFPVTDAACIPQPGLKRRRFCNGFHFRGAFHALRKYEKIGLHGRRSTKWDMVDHREYRANLESLDPV
jgi:hypothetical protein